MSAHGVFARVSLKRYSKLEKADSLLAPLLRNLGIEEGVRLAQIKNNWHKIFEKSISLHASPSKLSEGKLLLNVDSPIWIHQLTFCKVAIIDKLVKYGVKEVSFRMGKIQQRKQHQDIEGPPELSSEDSVLIAELVSGVIDRELKESIRGAVEKSFRTRNRK